MTKTIISLDPSLVSTGWSVIEYFGDAFRAEDWGLISPPKAMEKAQKLRIIYDALTQLVTIYKPCAIVTEVPFNYKNIKTAMVLSMIQGVILLVVAENDLEFYEYSPTKIKQAVTGRGRATKEQVLFCVTKSFGIENPMSLDTSDALATGMCHIQTEKMKQLLKDQHV